MVVATMERPAIAGGTPVRTAPLASVGNASGRDLGDEELAQLTEVIRSGTLSRNGGPSMSLQKRIDRLEQRLGALDHEFSSWRPFRTLDDALGLLTSREVDEFLGIVKAGAEREEAEDRMKQLAKSPAAERRARELAQKLKEKGLPKEPPWADYLG